MKASARPTKKRASEAGDELADLDLGYLALFLGLAVADTLQTRIDADGFRDLRFPHHFVFPALVSGRCSINELGDHLHVSQQMASRVVSELEELGYVERANAKSDGRARLVRLTPRGRAAIAANRRARVELEKKLVKRVGAERLAKARAALADALATLGGIPRISDRRIVAPRSV